MAGALKSAIARALLLAPGVVTGSLSEALPPSAAACTAGRTGCAIAQEHMLLQRSQAAVKHGSVAADVLDEIYFDAVVRDFKADHPDFESMDGHVTGLVESRLGADGKPVFRGGPALSTKENFDQWYNDVPGVNKRLPLTLALKHTSKGTYVYDSPCFYPIDGKGWGDSAVALDGKAHNHYFTLELRGTFIYRGGEMFNFRGDDDVWVFINGELVIDLGGVHNPIEGSVNLDTLNLTPGATVTLSFFFAERRCCGSNFRLETSIQFPVPKKGNCVLWGDPHVSVFDRSVAQDKESVPLLGFYNSGDFWLVKSGPVMIQGRFGPTRWTATGQAALLALAVGGPFLSGHSLVIEPMDGGAITWDGQEVLKKVPSELFIKDFVNISFHGAVQEDLIDPNQRGMPLRTVTARLPMMLDLVVNRWPKHIDAIIKMPQLEGQDGACGNFNQYPEDDTKELILRRGNAEVPPEESMLGPWPENLGEHGIGVQSQQELTLEDCKPKLREQAEKLCRKSRVGASGAVASKAVLEACIFDVCFGGKEFAAEDAAVDAAVEQQVGSG